MKEELLQLHLQMLQDKIDAFQDRVEALSEDAKNDAKSSAGDKHETALSMMHIEQEKLSAKINEYVTQQQELLRIDISRKSEIIAFEDLGAEAILKLEVKDFPVIVVMDYKGNDLYEKCMD